jgi:putative addiction module component (TIGR02574 family)
MAPDPAKVLQDALALPPEARAALVGSLISSLDIVVDSAAEEAWRDEICQRLEQIDGGSVQLISWEESRRRLRSPNQH